MTNTLIVLTSSFNSLKGYLQALEEEPSTIAYVERLFKVYVPKLEKAITAMKTWTCPDCCVNPCACKIMGVGNEVGLKPVPDKNAPTSNDDCRGGKEMSDTLNDRLPLDLWERALDDGTLLREYDIKAVLYKLIRAVRRIQTSEMSEMQELKRRAVDIVPEDIIPWLNESSEIPVIGGSELRSIIEAETRKACQAFSKDYRPTYEIAAAAAYQAVKPYLRSTARESGYSGEGIVTRGYLFEDTVFDGLDTKVKLTLEVAKAAIEAIGKAKP